MGEVWRRLSNTAGSELHSVFIQTLMDFNWGSWAQPTTLTGSKSGKMEKRAAARWIWHFTSAGGSTKSRVSPKSSWGGTSFRLQGPPCKPPPLFRNKKRGQAGLGLENICHIRNFGNCFSYCKKRESHVFSPSLLPTGTKCILLFMSISPSSLSKHLFFSLCIMSLFVIQLACWVRLHK